MLNIDPSNIKAISGWVLVSARVLAVCYCTSSLDCYKQKLISASFSPNHDVMSMLLMSYIKEFQYAKCGEKLISKYKQFVNIETSPVSR